MRVIVIKQATDWAALAPQLVAAGGDSAQALARLQRANPHLDFQKLGDGAVILVPEEPGLKASASDSIGGAAFGALQRQLNESVAATAADARAGWAALLTEQREVGEALKQLTNVIGADPDLKAQAEQAMAAAVADAAAAKSADAAYKTLEAQCTAELAALARLLGAAAAPNPPPAPSPVPTTVPTPTPVPTAPPGPLGGPVFAPVPTPVATPRGAEPKAAKPKPAPKGKR